MKPHNVQKVLVNSYDDRSYEVLFPNAEYVYEPRPTWEDWYRVDLVLLVGHFSDVDPQLYGQKVQGASGIFREQDLETMALIHAANHRKIPVLGICKGAQQLWVHLGGYLNQDVPRVGPHWIDLEGVHVDVEADHHQVMEGLLDDVSILATNKEFGYNEVFLAQRGSRMMGIQFHPEWMRDTDVFDYLMNVF